jgi:hypothetical protein
MKNETRIYLILGALAFIALCTGPLVFAAQHVITHQGDLDPIQFSGIVVQSLAIIVTVVFVINRLREKK